MVSCLGVMVKSGRIRYAWLHALITSLGTFEALDMNTAATLYETDFYGWIQAQADTLRARKFSELDLDNLLEEIESMGRSEKRSLTSALVLLLMHLLKWHFQPQRRSKSWIFSIREQQRMVRKILKENPSLKHTLAEVFSDAYVDALFMAEHDTKTSRYDFPQQCPWTFDEAIDFPTPDAHTFSPDE